MKSPKVAKTLKPTHPGQPLVIHHRDADGFGSAWLLEKMLGVPCEFYDINYNEPCPDVSGRPVFLVDFSFDRSTTEQIVRQASSFLMLDHHATAEESLGLHGCHFYMGRAGIRIVAEHLAEHAPADHPVRHSFAELCATHPGLQELVLQVEDRDLWHRALPQSWEYNSFVASRKYSRSEWDEILETPRADIIQAGHEVLAYEESLLKTMLDNCQVVEMDGHRGAAGMSIFLRSELADKILIESQVPLDFALVWSQNLDDLKCFCSLRTPKPEPLDPPRDWNARSLSEAHGGGGHEDAAGFRSSDKCWTWVSPLPHAFVPRTAEPTPLGQEAVARTHKRHRALLCKFLPGPVNTPVLQAEINAPCWHENSQAEIVYFTPVPREPKTAEPVLEQLPLPRTSVVRVAGFLPVL